MNLTKTIVFVLILIAATVGGWYYGADFLLCAYICITSLFLLAILFRFPTESYLLMHNLKRLEQEREKFMISVPKPKNIKATIRQYPEIVHFEKSKVRHHDSEKLISDTQKGMYIGFGIYAFLLLGGLMVSYLVQKYSATTSDPAQLKFYKEVFSLVMLGVGIAYMFIYFFPVTTQRSKNLLTLNESED